MNLFSKRGRTLGILLFSSGMLVNILFFALLTWPGVEAYNYFGYKPAQQGLTSLRCPFFLTTHETGQVTASYSNPSRLTLNPQFQVEISSPDLSDRMVDTSPAIAPGETKQLQWAITSNDLVFGRMILAEVYQSPVYNTPDRVGRCGTLWVDAPQLTGMQIFIGMLITGLLLTGLGWWLWMKNTPSNRAGRSTVMSAMLALTAIVLVGMIAGILGWWVIGVACMVLSLLLVVSTLGHLIIAHG